MERTRFSGSSSTGRLCSRSAAAAEARRASIVQPRVLNALLTRLCSRLMQNTDGNERVAIPDSRTIEKLVERSFVTCRHAG